MSGFDKERKDESLCCSIACATLCRCVFEPESG